MYVQQAPGRVFRPARRKAESGICRNVTIIGRARHLRPSCQKRGCGDHMMNKDLRKQFEDDDDCMECYRPRFLNSNRKEKVLNRMADGSLRLVASVGIARGNIV